MKRKITTFRRSLPSRCYFEYNKYTKKYEYGIQGTSLWGTSPDFEKACREIEEFIRRAKQWERQISM